MKKLLITLFALTTANISHAVVVQKIHLKNGSILYGYIQRQDTLGNYTIRTDSAIINLVDARFATKDDSLQSACFFTSITNNKVTYDENQLEGAWKKWAENNNKFLTEGTKKVLELNELTFATKDRTLTVKAKVLESGIRYRFLTLSNRDYNVSWNEIASIKSNKRQDTELSGINRIYLTKGGYSFEGQFAEETENTLGLYIDGAIRNFEVDDVVKYTFKKINTQQDIFEQSPLIDIVYDKKGNVARGLIIEQNYQSESEKENYILVQEESGGIKSVKFSELSVIEREENAKYSPKFDIVLPEGEVQVNRKGTKKTRVFAFDGNLHVDSITTNTTINKTDGQFDVEYNVKDYSDSDDYRLLKINTKTIKKRTYYFMTYEDLATVEYRRPISVEIRPKTVKTIYKIPTDGAGTYALYDSRKMEAIILKVE